MGELIINDTEITIYKDRYYDTILKFDDSDTYFIEAMIDSIITDDSNHRIVSYILNKISETYSLKNILFENIRDDDYDLLKESVKKHIEDDDSTGLIINLLSDGINNGNISDNTLENLFETIGYERLESYIRKEKIKDIK